MVVFTTHRNVIIYTLPLPLGIPYKLVRVNLPRTPQTRYTFYTMRRILPIMFGGIFLVCVGMFLFETKKDAANISQYRIEREESTAPKQEPQFLLFPVPKHATFTLGFSTSTPKTVLDSATGTTDIAINGGYFHEDYSPSGYLVASGERIGHRQFDEDKSGLLTITSNTIRIHDLNVTPLERIPHSDIAIQSYPFLIQNGEPAIKEDSKKLARRTAIGVTKQGDAYIIISKKQISLYALGQALAESSLSFETVLNLDGGPSTGVVYRTPTSTYILDSVTPVPQVLLIDALDW